MASRPTTPGGSSSSTSGNNVLANYQLGDSLGKGAFGQVYRALNWTTGETVAVKQIQLSNIPKGDLGEIMSEIDLLKNLNHTNIVKYKGFVKTREYLYIILEYCENGSLHNIYKRFGKFPESLVAVYISQVLEGLVYLHDQGVIHRDIKGANLLTNKDGSVKLADFGVASTTTAVSDNTVVGSPYWMAPEVIEQSGATTASDIWSVGCVVIELLEGKPPYHFLDPMPALFRIVQDDCPPIPEGASPIVKDFLYHCFQKDCNLRISAKKLLRHPWMVSARKQMQGEKNLAPGSGPTARPVSNFNHDEAVLRVQEWNEALKSPSRPSKFQAQPRRATDPRSSSPTPLPSEAVSASTSIPFRLVPLAAPMSLNAAAPVISNTSAIPLIREPVIQQPEEQDDNWDDDFEEGISFTKIQAMDKLTTEPEEEKHEADDNAKTIRPHKSPSIGLKPLGTMGAIVEDYSDLADEDEDVTLQNKVADMKSKHANRRGLFHPNDIKTVGLSGLSNGPKTAPLPAVTPPSLSRKPSLNRVPSMPVTPPATHSRASSVSGSFGQSEARRLGSYGDFDKYAEDDDEDYEDVFGKFNAAAVERPMQTLQLTTRLSNKSWLGDEDSDEDDPFAEIDEGFVEDDLEANLVRDKYARLTAAMNKVIEDLAPNAPDFALREACDQLMLILDDTPEMQSQLVSAHGMLAMLEVLEAKPSRDVILKLLRIVNLLVMSDAKVLESFCLIGGIPVLMEFTSKKYSSDCRLEASNFIGLLCHTTVLTLQMFISCRGLKVLVDLLDEDYVEQRDLVVHALNGIGNVFELQSPTPKNDFCRMLIREGLLDPLSSALINVMSTRGSGAVEMKNKIIQIILVFCQVSQSDVHVRNALGTRKVIRRLLRACELLEPQYLVLILRAVKHLSMSPTLLDVLQNANALEILIRILDDQDTGPHSAESSNHIFQTCYNLCRLNKSRQEEAAQAGIIPCLKRVIETSSPLKQFALPILCDLASAGKSCRTLLWQHDGLHLYLKLLNDPYFQVSALEAILAWLQDETARVEDILSEPSSLEALLKCFVSAKANSFENLLDPFLKICRISTSITLGVSKSQFFKRVIDRLGHGKAVVRLNLLRILRTACDVHPDRAQLVERFGIYEIVEKLSRLDGAVLVRELAREIMPVLVPGGEQLLVKAPGSSKAGALAPRRKGVRRAASETSALAFAPPPSHPPPVPKLGAQKPAGEISNTAKLAKARLPSRKGLADVAWPSSNG